VSLNKVPKNSGCQPLRPVGGGWAFALRQSDSASV